MSALTEFFGQRAPEQNLCGENSVKIGKNVKNYVLNANCFQKCASLKVFNENFSLKILP